VAIEVTRVVDAHVHLWDPARTDWYPFLSGGQELNMGDISGMVRKFDATTYFAESAKWHVEKFVHVAAAYPPFTVPETLEREELAEATGNPAAIVGSIGPSGSAAETIGSLDQQMAASPRRFRGVRAPGYDAGVPEPDVLRALQERNLVLDVMTHPDKLEEAAAALEDFVDLTIVVEHTGWPRTSSDEEFRLWQAGMAAFASQRLNVYCKLSGLAMPLGSMGVDVFRPWIEYCIEVFGTDRCMFASNFPVDGMHGTFDDLYGTYAELTAALDADDRQKLFATTAERVYRC
jgi:predicted TIM-barrel fold metal-dependent hydrolase